MKFLFLPGASGNREFWRPLAELLKDMGPSVIAGWPGLGGVPARPDITEFSQLIDLIVPELGPSTHVIAQSMGTVVAMQAALLPGIQLASLTLVVPAGGIDVQRLGATDWREGAPAWHPKDAPRYFFDEHSDLSQKLTSLRCRCLVISGGQDPLSPAGIGRRIAELIPHARHLVLPLGDHDLGQVYAGLLAQELRTFITA